MIDLITTELETLTNHTPSHLNAPRLETNYSLLRSITVYNYSIFYFLLEEQLDNYKTHQGSNRKPWWNEDPELRKLTKGLGDSQNDWIRCQNQTKREALWKCYKQKQRSLKLKVQNEKRIVINLRQEKMSVMKLTDTKRFRKTFNKIKKLVFFKGQR